MEFVSATRPSNRHQRYNASAKGKARTERYQPKRLELLKDQRENREFVAWDGEGGNNEEGRHVYFHVANSNGQSITNKNGLGTAEILKFLTTRSEPNVINVIFSASYDFNLMLIDLKPKELAKAYAGDFIKWRGFRIQWHDRKELYVKHVSSDTSIRLYDVWGYFQGSFISACEKYLGKNYPYHEEIAREKARRNEFVAGELLSDEELHRVIHYCACELELLVMLMDTLREYLKRVDLVPTKWYGPGSIVSKLFTKYNIPDHQSSDNGKYPDDLNRAIRCGYFGGRIEVIRPGYVAGAVEYDINSAYPWGLLDLPSFSDGYWEYREGDPGDLDFALYNIEYHSNNDGTLPQPLPQRNYSGSVFFPADVEGWYWTPEYRMLKTYLQIVPEAQAIVYGAWVWVETIPHRPFAFIGDLYRERQIMKAAGDGAEKALKLAMNSCYGKLCQQIGAHEVKDADETTWKIPSFHQLEWAGYLTSKCRASVMTAALQNLDAVIAFETDALFMAEPIALPTGKMLGEWEELQVDELMYIQSGVYIGAAVKKSRGFDPSLFSIDSVKEAWNAGRRKLTFTERWFITAGISLRQNRMADHCQWIERPRNIRLFASNKRTMVGGYDPTIELTRTRAAHNYRDELIESQPYKVSWPIHAHTTR